MINTNNNEENITMLCHELRSPLTSIKGYLCALKDGIIPPDKQCDYINTALEESDRMMKMIDNFMLISKVSVKNPILNTEVFDINALITSILEEKSSLTDNLIVKYKFSQNQLFVSADKNLIHEVISNIVDNSVKYGKKDGITTINSATAKSGDKAVIQLGDLGNGIPKEYISLIWDKYFTTSSTKHSVGMGLYLAKNIINAHGEKISVESQPDTGTIFTFTLTAFEKQ